MSKKKKSKAEDESKTALMTVCYIQLRVTEIVFEQPPVIDYLMLYHIR